MKRNAIIRICVYAGLILLLIAILCMGIFGMSPRLSIGLREDFVMATMAPMSEAAVPVTMPVEERAVLATGRTLFDLDVYASPATVSSSIGRLVKGASVNIWEMITTNGEEWAYVDGATRGWVQLPLLELDGETSSEEITVVSDAIETATAKEKVNIRDAPSKGASAIGTLEGGSPVTVQQMQSTMGTDWAYIEGTDSQGQVIRGWVVMEYLEPDEEAENANVEITERHGSTGNATALDNVNIRSAPALDAPACGLLSKDSQADVTQIVTTKGIDWAYVIQGENQGWVAAKYLKVDENFQSSLEAEPSETQEVPPETTVTLLEEGEPGVRRYHQSITGLDITWPSGKVTVETGDVELPEVRAEDGTAQCSVTDKGRLKIEAVSKLLNFKKKDLTVVFPKNYNIEKLELDIASADAVIRDLPGELNEMEIDTASGACSLENLSVKELEIDSASGPVSFVGSVERLDFEGASANLSAVIQNHPKKMELTNEIGRLVLTLPKDFGFTAENKGKTGGFMTDFTDTKPGSNVFGDGSCKVEINNPNGSIDIRKNGQ